MTTLISACGLDCAKCDSYIATQANDLAALEQIAAKWAKEYNAPGMTALSVQCDSCMAEGRKIGHCAECKIRACVVEHGLENCSACPDYACEQLTAFFQMAPQAKANLDALR
jgi:hypothetical protein